MTVVVDASTVVAALVDRGRNGRWARGLLREGHLAAPHLLPVEVAHTLRRLETTDEVSPDAATMAHADLQALGVDLFPYVVVASRVWELRANVTPYDALYVGLAELLDAPLATLDRRLARSPGPACAFLLPPGRPQPGRQTSRS